MIINFNRVFLCVVFHEADLELLTQVLESESYAEPSPRGRKVLVTYLFW